MELGTVSKKIIVFGAQSIALGVGLAFRALFPEKELLGFMVSSRDGNPGMLDRLPVMEIQESAKKYAHEKDEITVLVGTPETTHKEITPLLVEYGFLHFVCIGWELEEWLMEQYYRQEGSFSSLHCLTGGSQSCDYLKDAEDICVFQVKSHMDCGLEKPQPVHGWVHTLQAGAADTSTRIGEYADNTGENISGKNRNYCELTALYWVWKNMLETGRVPCEYCGIFQYRRLLDIRERDIRRMRENSVDAVLPFPTVHAPDIREHHQRYVNDGDWSAMLEALEELHPKDASVLQTLLRQPYFYNYNILVAKKELLMDYCSWLFPILERTEELSRPKGCQRGDRYIGYLGESLQTLYFMGRAGQLNIVHTGRQMLV